MTKRMAIWATVFATCCIALAYLSAFVDGGTRWGVWCMVLGLATMVVALMALGVSRRGGGVGALAVALLEALGARLRALRGGQQPLAVGARRALVITGMPDDRELVLLDPATNAAIAPPHALGPGFAPTFTGTTGPGIGASGSLMSTEVQRVGAVSDSRDAYSQMRAPAMAPAWASRSGTLVRASAPSGPRCASTPSPLAAPNSQVMPAASPSTMRGSKSTASGRASAGHERTAGRALGAGRPVATGRAAGADERPSGAHAASETASNTARARRRPGNHGRGPCPGARGRRRGCTMRVVPARTPAARAVLLAAMSTLSLIHI